MSVNLKNPDSPGFTNLMGDVLKEVVSFKTDNGIIFHKNKLLTLESELSFEEIIEFFQSKKFKETKLVVTLYHWVGPDDPDLTMKSLKKDVLYLCDKSWCWASSHLKGMRLYAVSVVLENPLCLPKQWDSGEFIVTDDPGSKRKLAAQREIDCVIVTPHPWSDEPELRELKLLNAKKSVLAIQLLGET